MLLKDANLRDRASASLVLIGDTAIEPLVAFLHDPTASEVETEGERVMSFATSRLTLADALRQAVMETLKKLGWEPPHERRGDQFQRSGQSSRQHAARRHRPVRTVRRSCQGSHVTAGMRGTMADIDMADSVLEQIAALKDDDWAVREEAATALADIS